MTTQQKALGKALKERDTLLQRSEARLAAQRAERAVQHAPVPERAYRVTLTIRDAPADADAPGMSRYTDTISGLRQMFPFLGELHLTHRYSYGGHDYKEAVFAAVGDNVPTLLNNGLIAGCIAAYRVQLPETVLA